MLRVVASLPPFIFVVLVGVYSSIQVVVRSVVISTTRRLGGAGGGAGIVRVLKLYSLDEDDQQISKQSLQSATDALKSDLARNAGIKLAINCAAKEQGDSSLIAHEAQPVGIYSIRSGIPFKSSVLIIELKKEKGI